MTIISRSRKALFIKTRKTAGTSIQDSLLPHLDDLQDICTIQNANILRSGEFKLTEFSSVEEVIREVPEASTYFKFGFTRNPFDIATSRFAYEVKMKRIDLPLSSKGLNDYIQKFYFVPSKRFPSGRFFLDRSRLLLFNNNFHPIVDFIGKVENISEDFEFISNHIGLPNTNLEHSNKSRDIDLLNINFLDDYSKDLIRLFFDFEFDYFGYPKDV